MSDNVLIVDGNNLCYRAYYKFARLSSKGGHSTSLIFGFPKVLKPVLSRHKPIKVYVVFDGKKSKHRLAIHPEYKAGRKKSLDFNAEDFYHQRDVLKDMLPHFGINVVWGIDYEADDLIYILSQRVIKHGNRAIILSSDKDFHQLITDNIWVEHPKFEATLKPHNFNHYIPQYKPETCVDYICLDGDSSDNIPGVPGFGPKTLVAFFEEFETVKDYLLSDRNFRKFNKKELEVIWVRNRKLIDLRLFNIKYLDKQKNVPMYKRGKFDRVSIVEYMHKYDIKTFADKKFIEPFKAL